MSIETVSHYRVKCSGECGKWLASWVVEYYTTTLEFEANRYPTYADAEAGAHNAGWFDGHDGRLAAGQSTARLVPICPPCREKM